MDEQELLGLRGLALDDEDPIRRTIAVELLVMEARRLQAQLVECPLEHVHCWQAADYLLTGARHAPPR